MTPSPEAVKEAMAHADWLGKNAPDHSETGMLGVLASEVRRLLAVLHNEVEHHVDKISRLQAAESLAESLRRERDELKRIIHGHDCPQAVIARQERDEWERRANEHSAGLLEARKEAEALKSGNIKLGSQVAALQERVKDLEAYAKTYCAPSVEEYARRLESENAALAAKVKELDEAHAIALKKADDWFLKCSYAENKVLELQERLEIKGRLLVDADNARAGATLAKEAAERERVLLERFAELHKAGEKIICESFKYRGADTGLVAAFTTWDALVAQLKSERLPPTPATPAQTRDI